MLDAFVATLFDHFISLIFIFDALNRNLTFATAVLLNRVTLQLSPAHAWAMDSAIDVDKILTQISDKYKEEQLDLVDGVRIDFEDSWVQLRKSNTEPIIRIYSEARSEEKARRLIGEIDTLVKNMTA